MPPEEPRCSRWFSHLYLVRQAAFWTAAYRCRWLAPFVKKNHISLKECTAKQFISFNDFFVRKLKMDARPFSNAPQDFISPCDARLTVYPIHENGKFEIKNTEYTLEQLLRDRKLAKRYEGGTLFLFRLSVDDYHRYLFVDDGVCSTERRIEGVLHTVNPAANDFCPIYKEKYENLHAAAVRKFRHTAADGGRRDDGRKDCQ